jgi:hypothetical protein
MSNHYAWEVNEHGNIPIGLILNDSLWKGQEKIGITYSTIRFGRKGSQTKI